MPIEAIFCSGWLDKKPLLLRCRPSNKIISAFLQFVSTLVSMLLVTVTINKMGQVHPCACTHLHKMPYIYDFVKEHMHRVYVCMWHAAVIVVANGSWSFITCYSPVWIPFSDLRPQKMVSFPTIRSYIPGCTFATMYTCTCALACIHT